MQKAQDLHIKHLYAIGEDQDSVISSSDALPEITINEVTAREDRGGTQTNAILENIRKIRGKYRCKGGNIQKE